MSYRLPTKTKPLIMVECQVESHSTSRLEFIVKAKSQFKSKSVANNVEILIAVPDDVDTPAFNANVGTVQYVPDKDVIIWKVSVLVTLMRITNIYYNKNICNITITYVLNISPVLTTHPLTDQELP